MDSQEMQFHKEAFDKIPQEMQNAIVAIENERFFKQINGSSTITTKTKCWKCCN